MASTGRGSHAVAAELRLQNVIKMPVNVVRNCIRIVD
jgi:hypothetical protein